jgi:hypothetical protein
MNNVKAPIVLFVYNRLWHTTKTVEALQKNLLSKYSTLFIFSDGARSDKDIKAVSEVREYCKSINGFNKVEIIERESNFGLAASIVDGVTKIVNEYGKIIVLEDDLVTSPFFLDYMNEGLDLYQDIDEVISIHGYTYPVNKKLPDTFFIRGADCWGWATWRNSWKLFEPNSIKLLFDLNNKKLKKQADFNNCYPFTQMLVNHINGKNDSWAIRWYMSAFLNNKLTLYPGISLINNIGNDSSGTHSETTSVLDIKIENKKIIVNKIEIIESKIAFKEFSIFLKQNFNPSLFVRLKKKINKLIN